MRRRLFTIRTLEGRVRPAYAGALLARLLGVRRYALPPTLDSVLFLCHGNIMRSAAADRLLRLALERRGVTGVTVTSAGMHAKEGREAMPQVVRAVGTRGASLVTHCAARATPERLRAADVVFAMDYVNLVEARALVPDHAARIVMFAGVGDAPYVGDEIADPYGHDDAVVEATIGVVAAHVERLADVLAERARRPERVA